MRKFIVAFLLFAFSANICFAFPDVIDSTMYKNSINYLQELGILEGYEDGTFKPENEINRAEMLKILAEGTLKYNNLSANVLDEYEDESCFPDVPANEWFTKYVCYAKNEGWVLGYPDGTFKPSKNVNYVEAQKMTLQALGIDYDENTSPWYKGFVEIASEKHYVPCISKFEHMVSRSDMSDMIARVLKDKEGLLEAFLGEYFYKNPTYETIQTNADACDYEITYDEQKAIWRAELVHEYDLAKCRATEFPSLMMFKVAATYKYCQELEGQKYDDLESEFDVLKAEIEALAAPGNTITWDEYYAYEAQLNDLYDRGVQFAVTDYWDVYHMLGNIPKDTESNPEITGMALINDYTLSNNSTYEALDSEILISGNWTLTDNSSAHLRNCIIRLADGATGNSVITVSGNATLEMEDIELRDLDHISFVFEDSAQVILDNVSGDGSWYAVGPSVNLEIK